MEEKQVEDKFKRIFDAYLRLESESYEFIIRTIAMHNWLREAHRLLQEKPELSAEEMYEAWQTSFDQIYGHLFAAFLRPYRVMMFPFGEYLRAQFESSPRTSAGTYLGLFRVWGEAQSKFLQGVADAFRSYSQESDKLLEGHEEGAIDKLQELMPMSLMRKIADEETLAYFEALEEFLGYFGESQFLLPKTFILHLQKVVSSYPKAYRLAQRYEAMFRNTWEKSLRRFTLEVKKNTGVVVEFDGFFNSYIGIFAEEYDQLLRAPEFIEAQTNFIGITSEAVISMRKAMEAQLELFPALPFVTGTEVDALEQRVHGHKKRLDGLERRVRDMQHQLNMMLKKAEIESQPEK